jgi:hypothetical protein
VRFAFWCDRVHRDSPHDHIRPQVLDGLPGDRIIKKNTATASQLLSSCLSFDVEAVTFGLEITL